MSELKSGKSELGMQKIAEVNGQTLDEHRLLSDMVSFTRENLNRLQHTLLNEQTEFNRVKREIEDTKRQAKYDSQVQRQKFLDSLEAEKGKLQTERHSLELLDLELAGRAKDVEALEAKAQPILASLQKLQNERIAIEQQRVRNQELLYENDRLSNEIGTRYEEVKQLKEKLTLDLARVNKQASEQDHVAKRLENQEKDVGLQVENLTALKTQLDPKLSEIKKLQQQAESDREQAKTVREGNLALQADLDKQKSDLAILSSQLEAKTSALLEFDAQLKQLEAEVRVKVQQAQVQKVEVSKIPERPPLLQPDAQPKKS